MKTLPPCLALLLAALFAFSLGRAQVPSQLQQAIPPPFVARPNAEFGFSAAINDQYIVVGAPGEDAVKILDAATRAPLLSIPAPHSGHRFGNAVAISGSLVAAGALSEPVGGISGAGSVYVFDLHSATPTIPLFVLPNPNPTANDAFSRVVRLSGTTLVVTKDGINSGGSVIYVYDLASATPAVPIGTLLNPQTEANHFPGTVALSGTRVAVRGYFGTGVYVYDLANGVTAPPVATLPDPDSSLGNGFGTALDISGTVVAVGASDEPIDSSGDYGAVYVFDLASATPSVPLAKLPDPRVPYFSVGTFGTSIAVSGTRVLVGNYYYYNGPIRGGFACVFDYSSATPTVPVAEFDNPTSANDDWFGYAVAISGAHVVVGARLDDTVAPDAGSAYYYDLESALPTTPTTLLFPAPSFFDFFGKAMAVSGRWMVVGNLYDATDASNTGAVYIYDLAGASPGVPMVRLANPNQQQYSNFGCAVALFGTTLVVGADQTNSSAGIVYVYDLANLNSMAPILTLQKPSAAPNDEFGEAVAISGTRVLVGAPNDDTGATDAGGAYVFDLAGANPTVPVFTLHEPHPVMSDHFGYQAAISGTKLVVGNLPGATAAGSAYVFDLGGTIPTTPIVTLHKPASAAGDYFGVSLAIEGSRLVVGAPGDNTGASYAGSAYVYELGSGTPTVPAITLHNPVPVPAGGFGGAVALSGQRLVVGTYDYGSNIDPDISGSAYVYDLTSMAPVIPVATLHNPHPTRDDLFGAGLAIDGTTLIVGAPNDSTVAFGKGYAFIFGPNPHDLDNNGLLDAWEIARFGNATGHLATDDDDQDGFINLLKEAFGAAPSATNTAAAVPAPIVEDGYLTLALTKHPGVTYEVQSAATPDPAAFSAATTTVLVDDSTTLKVRDNFLLGITPGRFLRVKVTAAP